MEGKNTLRVSIGGDWILNVRPLMKVKFQLSNFHHIDFETTSLGKMGIMGFESLQQVLGLSMVVVVVVVYTNSFDWLIRVQGFGYDGGIGKPGTHSTHESTF